MPSGYQISSLCRGDCRPSMSACLKYQMFQTKVDSSKAHCGTPGMCVVRCRISGQVSNTLSSV